MAVAKSKKRGLRLRLYIAGNAPNSVRAVANAKAICLEHYKLDHELEIIDMFDSPGRAIEDGIIVTPTLLKLGPPPIARAIGDLSDTAQVLLTLGRE